MSAITTFLQDNPIINYSLTSDTLTVILSDICQFLVDQTNAIDRVKQDIGQCASKSELMSLIGEQHTEIGKLKEEIEQLKAVNDETEISLTDLVKVTEDRVSKRIQDQNETTIRNTDQKLKDLRGEVFVIHQELKEVNEFTTTNMEAMQPLSDRVHAIERWIEESRQQSLDVLAAKVQTLEMTVADLQTLEGTHKREIDAAIEGMKSAWKESSRDWGDAMKQANRELKELRRMILDAPTIECENGIADTEAIIRAIQRDSRRLDNFNEIIMSVKQEHNAMRGLFATLNRCVEQIQGNVLEIVKDGNHTKSELVAFSHDTRQKTGEIAQKVTKCSVDIGEAIDATMTGMNLISNTFLQIFSFLGKITTRPLPVFGSFDDSLLEFQRISDASSALNEKYEDEKRIRDAAPPRELDLDPAYALPSVEIPAHNIELPRSHAKRRKESDAPRSPTPAPVGDAQLCVDAELRDTIASLQGKVDRLRADASVQREVLERKADAVTVDRITEKLRITLQKLRDKQRHIANSLVFCIQRDEAEPLIKHILVSSNAQGETAAGKSHVQCLVCGRTRSQVTAAQLPNLNSSVTAHDLVYGGTRASSSKKSTRPRSERRTPDKTSDRPAHIANNPSAGSLPEVQPAAAHT
jgi:uncharacterized small protein (DUF1192 family)